jgi:N-methylhydantoinase A
LGFLYSDVKNEFAQTFVRNIDDADPAQIGDILTRLGRDARAWLREEGIDESRQRLNYEADVRYFRQGYEFSLEIDPDRLGSGAFDDLAGRFGLAHERIYGFKLSQPVELVNLRAVGIGAVQKISLPKFGKEGPDAAHAVVEQHRAYFDGGFTSVNVYDRAKLKAGNRIRGPAIIIQMDATTVIHPNHTGEVDEYLSILITPDKAS